jgi:hypothetical protein
MSKERRTGLRILVGAASFADAVAGVRIVQKLPSSFCAGLGGLLVEEVDIFTACEIPDQRIVLSSGKTALAPNLSQLRTLLNADARAFRRLLAQASRPGATQWAFMQDKGELVRTALQAATGWDVLVLGYRQTSKVLGKVILLQKSGPPSENVQEAFSRLSHRLAGEPIVFSIKENGDEAVSAQTSNTIQFKTLDDALRVLARTNAQAVVVDFARGPIHNQNDLLRLLEAARCPVFVFDASNPSSVLENSMQIPPQ